MNIRVELHCHTNSSSDSLMSISQLVAACKRKNIQKIAITDHNSISNALLAKQKYPDLIIVGEEIFTRQGELLAFFIKEEIPAGLDMQEALTALRNQNAFISVSHPFDRYRKGHWQLSDLLQITDQIDAVESFNSRCIMNEDNHKAAEFAAQHQLLTTVGSDAHSPMEIGRAIFTMPDFDTPQSFRQSLLQAQPSCKLSSPLIHILSRYAKWKKAIQMT